MNNKKYPSLKEFKPKPEFIERHNENVYLG